MRLLEYDPYLLDWKSQVGMASLSLDGLCVWAELELTIDGQNHKRDAESIPWKILEHVQRLEISPLPTCWLPLYVKLLLQQVWIVLMCRKHNPFRDSESSFAQHLADAPFSSSDSNGGSG